MYRLLQFLPVLLLGVIVTGECSWAASIATERFPNADRRARIEKSFAAMDDLVRTRMGELGLPGTVYGVVVDGRLAHTGAFGFLDLDRQRPVEMDSIFRIASMTKSFTALAILLLRDEGKLALDDAAARFVPELESLPLPTADSSPITIRQLLTHQAGFPEDNPWADRQMEMSQDEFSALLASAVPFSSAPGTQFEYSNLGFAILGRIVSNVSGQAYPEFVHQRILTPLQMTSTYLDIDAVPRNRLATGYGRGNGHAAFAPGGRDGEYVQQRPLGNGAFGPIGGLFTDAGDLAKWIAAMLAAFPASDQNTIAGIPKHAVREMQVGQGFPRLIARRRYVGGPVDAKATVYGFGLRVTQTCEFGRLVDHSGGFPGFGSNMQWLPDYGVGVFVMANRTYASAGGIAHDLLQLVDESGGLVARSSAVSPVLGKAAHDVFKLVDEWDDAAARTLAADNFHQDRALDLRRRDIAESREGLGQCRMGDIGVENTLRGNFRMNCDNGWLDVSLTLAPTTPPLLQYLQVRRGGNPSPVMQKLIEQILDSIRTNELPPKTLHSLDRNALGAKLWLTRSNYGSCVRQGVLGGDGVTKSQVTLSCDRGMLQMTVGADGDQLASVDFAPLKGRTCAL